MMTNNLIIYTDGGSRGNPGQAAVGVYITNAKGEEIVRFGKRIGETTNNTAEYLAVITALDYLKEKLNQEIQTITFFLDSLLVVNQLNGLYKIKESHLQTLAIKIKKLAGERPGKVFYNYVPREKNRVADSLVNQALNSFN